MKLAILICVSVLIYISAANQGATSDLENGCTRNYAPVCGDDGNTYSNECMLHWENKEHNPNVKVKHEGICATS